MKTFFQSKDGKLFPMVPVTRCYTWPFANIVGKTIPTGWPRGTGRAFIAETGANAKRKRGKPFLAARVRGDWIVAYVRELQRDQPHRKLDMDIIKQAARFWKVDPKTVWNALRLDRKLGPYAPIPLDWIGPIRYGRTIYTSVVRGPPASITPAPMAPEKVPGPEDFPDNPYAALLSRP